MLADRNIQLKLIVIAERNGQSEVGTNGQHSTGTNIKGFKCDDGCFSAITNQFFTKHNN
jgi:hypothetical protein